MSNDALSHLPTKPINLIYYRLVCSVRRSARTPSHHQSWARYRHVAVCLRSKSPRAKALLQSRWSRPARQTVGKSSEEGEHSAGSACGVFQIVILTRHRQDELLVRLGRCANFWTKQIELCQQLSSLFFKCWAIFWKLRIKASVICQLLFMQVGYTI